MWNQQNAPRRPRTPNPNQSPAANDPYQAWGQGQYSNQGDTQGNAPTERFDYAPEDDSSTNPSGAPPYQPPAYQPPAYAPEPPRYPHGRPPQWPGPQSQRQQPLPYSLPVTQQPDQRQIARHETYRDERDSDYAPAPPRPRPRPRLEPHYAEREQAPRSAYRALPHLPIAHVLLIAGIAAMTLAITRPWATDASGTAIFVQNFTNARISAASGVDTGALAQKVAIGTVGLAAILSAALILINLLVSVIKRVFGVVGLSGCASLVLFPLLWGAATLLFLVLLGAAGFAGLGKLSALPLIQQHGFALVDVNHYALGFYLWCIGIGATFIGMLGQLALRRR